MTLVDDPGGAGVGRRVLLVGIGTRGDVEPLVRLGSALRRRGDDPVVAVLADGEDVVAAAGLRPLVVGPPAAEAMWWPSPLARSLALTHPGAMYQQTRTRLARHAEEIAAGLSPLLAPPAADGATPEDTADLVVCGLAAAGLVPVLRRAGLPARLALHAPLLPHTAGTSAWRTGISALLPEPVEAGRQSLMWSLTQGLSSALGRAQARRWADVAPADPPLPPAPPLLSTSPVLDPDPSPDVVQTGWWDDPHPVRPLPEQVDRWLDDHPDAVLLSVGSLAQVDPEEEVAQLAAVAARVGSPAVVQVHEAAPGPRPPAGGSSHHVAPPDVLVVGDVDHRALLPRVRAVVHHGGSGTTHAAAAAGRPQLVVPRLGDQPHYGRQVHRAGLGPLAVPHTRASVRSLSEALLDVLTEPSYARAATGAAHLLAAEDGLGRAVDELAATGDRAGAAR
ncbi:glycosyltransferase [Ornithinimicrobium flavum]|uniref:glycosyltransferase n=1 Tax=Ornithinimicrobium flavum TaxID=1288636 RepID=UPI00106FDA28|nr:glycosyltransferase [Ornithinimicrobium flavum]